MMFIWYILIGIAAGFIAGKLVRGGGLGLFLNLIVGIIGGIVGLNAILSGLYSLALLIPSLAISVRRLQDIDKEWYWILISLIPLVGSIWLIVLYCQPGTPSDNRFGKVPDAE